MDSTSCYMDKLSTVMKQLGVEWNSAELAAELDRQDPLAQVRSQFCIPINKHLPNVDLERMPPDGECIYLSGNSLGLKPKKTKELVLNELEKWDQMGAHGRFNGSFPWSKLELCSLDLLARVVGGKAIEVSPMASLTVNLHLLLVPFYKPTPTRYKILMEGKSFSSDFIAVKSQLKFRGYDPDDSIIEIEARENCHTLATQDILDVIEKEGDSIALILFGGVHYYTGQAFDMKAITAAGHKKGCVVGFDLAHAVGNVPLSLHDWDVDFACWCSYKYLNAGAGAIGGIFVHERHAEDFSLNRFGGWWGHEWSTRLEISHEFKPEVGAAGFLVSNPDFFRAVCLHASLEIFDEVGMDAVRQKSVILTGYLEFLLLRCFTKEQLTILTPSSPEERGCQLSLMFIGCQVEKMSAEFDSCGVVHDLRKPNIIRIAPTPLYNSFRDVHIFATLVKSSYARLTVSS